MPDDAGRAPVVAHQEGPVLHVRLNRPEVLNAITTELAGSLAEALTGAGRAPDIRVIVVRGEGGNFSVGGDFDEVRRLMSEGRDALRDLFENFGDACEAIPAVAVPVVAAVEGYAMAGGFELMQACDLAVVRDDAVIADNHLNFGLIPGGGGTQRLPRLVGRQRALGHILTGDRLSGSEAVTWGLAYRSASAADFEKVLDNVIRKLTAQDPQALAAAKRLVYEGCAMPLPDGLALERDAIVNHLQGASARRAVEELKHQGDDG